MLTKDLLRVSRAGGGYHPQFVGDDPEARDLAARVIGVYQGHVGEERADLEAALTELEGEASDFKLVRGFAKLLEREAAFETRAADRLDTEVDAVAESLYADLDDRAVMTAFDARYDPAALVAQYDLSLAGTALFDAVEVRVRSTEPKELVSAVKRLRLMYEIRRLPDGERDEGPSDREVVVTGPSAPFSRSRRYGTRFARLLRTVAGAPAWRLEATVDDRGTERELVLTDGEVSVPGTEPVVEPSYDSGVERDFATRFEALALDWELVREPEPLESGARVVIPDFAFDYRPGEVRRFRVFFEIMGFWTPEYVAKKLSGLADLEDVTMLVAVDESLGVGEEVAALTDGAIPYRGTVRVKDVVDALRGYEAELVADAAAELPGALTPADDVVTIETLAARHGVGEGAVEGKSFPEHDRVGRTLVRPAVLDALAERVEPGMALEDAETVLDEYGLDDASAALAALDYRVEWDGLSGGTVQTKNG